MICPTCKENKKEEDYYWHKKVFGFVPQRRYKQCKDCVLKQKKKELKEKNEYAKQYFI